MEVGIRSGVCNNSPAEWIGPENGWRLPCSLYPTVRSVMVERVGGRSDRVEVSV